MNGIKIKDKEIFIPKNDLNKLNINKNTEVLLNFEKEGVVIRFKEKKRKFS